MAFDIQIDKDVVRRILATHYRPKPDADGPSWLTFIGHLKDSLWSIDLFRCESARLRTHWIVVVMDQYTRRIIGFGVQVGKVDGPLDGENPRLGIDLNRSYSEHAHLPTQQG